jgi:hypothetical protein
MEELAIYSEGRELEAALSNALSHFGIDLNDAIEFALRDNSKPEVSGRPDRGEALVWLLGGSEMSGIENSEAARLFFDFDQRRLKDSDDDGWPEYYSRDNRKFEFDISGEVFVR